jgi:hypothetical protein
MKLTLIYSKNIKDTNNLFTAIRALLAATQISSAAVPDEI